MPDDIDTVLNEETPKLAELEFGVDYLHWSIGWKFERPRASKHTYHRWIFKVRFLCFDATLKRLNETRVPKPPTTGVTIGKVDE